ncbi:hypothetical protein NHX12_021384 [Muraenolepis orangiensis]|uniref:Uncharacterized protein n=1 Tax=Muraenolepis orangiensis TaxID=630683 RepID=A0A9Q0IVH6_9TELE|nr:hypothetical protein NHX12_021384 [Muraenolepis orangiensis]
MIVPETELTDELHVLVALLLPADLLHADLLPVDLLHADLLPVDLLHADLLPVDLLHADLLPVDLLHADLLPVDLLHADLLPVDLLHADLLPVDLLHTDLLPIDLLHADLLPVDLLHADLLPVDLLHTDLLPVDLLHADLLPVDLIHADLLHADLLHTDLLPVDLLHTDLLPVDLLPCLGPALLSCVEAPDRLSNYPIQSQHYPPFQSTEPYYNSHNALGEAPPTLQKSTNPRLYMPRPGCGYEFPGYLPSGPYPAPLHRDPAANHNSDLCDPRVAPVLGSSCSSSASYDPQSTKGWRDLLKNATPYGENHYYTPEYPCRYPSNTPGSPGALQTIITTTTKVAG